MPQSLAKIIVHIVFSTKNRFPYLNQNIRTKMHAYLAGTVKNLGSHVYAINGTSDHVHIVCELPRTISLSKFIEEIKKSSSLWIKRQDVKFQKFYWQKGYGAFSVSPSNLPLVIQYVQNQEKHHQRVSFQEELISFLKNSGVEYDEKFLWD